MMKPVDVLPPSRASLDAGSASSGPAARGAGAASVPLALPVLATNPEHSTWENDLFLPTPGMTLGFTADRSVMKRVQDDAVGNSKDARAVQWQAPSAQRLKRSGAALVNFAGQRRSRFSGANVRP